MSDEKMCAVIRGMAWERAKGELRSMAHTFWGEMDKFRAMDKVVEEFIRKVEDEGLHE